jgi:sensor histidine kinase regulating citrate/malate metabolism
VHLLIADNGEGFDESRKAQLFRRGYSTREHKRGGLGLHWCANSVSAMGGRIALDSKGPGSGATAHLHLPAAASRLEQVAA